MLIRRVARPMLATTFIARGVDSLRSPKPAADAARPTLDGLSKLPDPVGPNVPTDAETVAKVTAGVQIGAGLLLATGKLPRLASAALAFSVVPGSLGAHAFWNETDPERKANERRAFLADVSLIGGLIIAAVDTEGKPSLGWRGRRAARKVSDSVAGVLPSSSSGALIDSDLVDRVGQNLQSGLHVGAERGRELAQVASKRGAEFAEVASKRGAELAEVAQKRGAVLAEVARDRGAELAEVARDRGAEFADVASKRGSEWADVASKRGSEFADVASKRGDKLAKKAQKRSEKLAAEAQKRSDKLAKKAQKRGPELVSVARSRGLDLADRAIDRGYEFADLASDRGAELAETARKQAKQARKDAKKQARRLS
ncbi:DoxX family protein [Mycolicibacterium grossiae]|uniref:DoxX family protein n=1 Tax=Mycolicibacterium grossiae TaxID=1552759 RepID=A0A1E8QBE2_9MYCO|nr:DoxX family protein [Mycolicibacterium grossiae]OFJ55410.1 DoxX family protein [Mycolicibacterium grossiae]QEM47004.1 DoxX family membrane protein [Mycolicibacterium grossiae]